MDSTGLLIACCVTPASTSDHAGCKRLLAGFKPLVPRLEAIWADSAYTGEKLAEWCRTEGGWRLEVVKRRPVPRFEVVPRRWVVERTLAWISRNLRLARDYERLVQTTETLIQVAMMRLMLQRLAPT